MNKTLILKKRKDFIRVAKGVKLVASTVLLQAAPSFSCPKKDRGSQADNNQRATSKAGARSQKDLSLVSSDSSSMSSQPNLSSASSFVAPEDCVSGYTPKDKTLLTQTHQAAVSSTSKNKRKGIWEPPSYRVGFTTTKKIGKAHIRNRVRRRLRAVVREVFPKTALAHTDYVLIGRFNTAECPYNTLKSEIKWALKKANRILQGEEPAPIYSNSGKAHKHKSGSNAAKNDKHPQIIAETPAVPKPSCSKRPESGKLFSEGSIILLKPLKYLCLTLIKFYQKFISPLFPGCCRFRPTCSQYMLEAIKIHGVIKGLYLGIRRILRCHPWGGGSGYDPVPPKSCANKPKE